MDILLAIFTAITISSSAHAESKCPLINGDFATQNHRMQISFEQKNCKVVTMTIRGKEPARYPLDYKFHDVVNDRQLKGLMVYRARISGKVFETDYREYSPRDPKVMTYELIQTYELDENLDLDVTSLESNREGSERSQGKLFRMSETI